MATNYLLDLNSSLTQVLGEFKPGDDTWYLLGLDVIGQQQSSGWGYFGYDGLGSVREVTDSLGALQYATSYAPYGSPFEQFSSPNTPLGFTGEFSDPSGLLYLRARYLSPQFGAFLSKDPFPGVGTMAMSQNGYSYVHGNPVNWIDPSGRTILGDLYNALQEQWSSPLADYPMPYLGSPWGKPQNPDEITENRTHSCKLPQRRQKEKGRQLILSQLSA